MTEYYRSKMYNEDDELKVNGMGRERWAGGEEGGGREQRGLGE